MKSLTRRSRSSAAVGARGSSTIGGAGAGSAGGGFLKRFARNVFGENTAAGDDDDDDDVASACAGSPFPAIAGGDALAAGVTFVAVGLAA